MFKTKLYSNTTINNITKNFQLVTVWKDRLNAFICTKGNLEYICNTSCIIQLDMYEIKLLSTNGQYMIVITTIKFIIIILICATKMFTGYNLLNILTGHTFLYEHVYNIYYMYVHISYTYVQCSYICFCVNCCLFGLSWNFKTWKH